MTEPRTPRRSPPVVCVACGSEVIPNSGLRQVYNKPRPGLGLCPECTMSAGDMNVSPARYIYLLTGERVK